MVDWLLSLGHPVNDVAEICWEHNVRKPRKVTALQTAVLRGSWEVCERLLQGGADPLTWTARSGTALSLAKLHKGEEAAAIMRQYVKQGDYIGTRG